MLDATVTSICYFNGAWGTGAVPLMTSATNAAWLANAVFDGARAFEGVAPDLDLHCQRSIRSAAGPADEAARHGRARARARRSRASPVPGRRAALHPADVLGRERPGRRRPRLDAVRAGHHQDAAARSGARLLAVPVAVPAAAAPSRRPTHAKAACLYPMAGLAIADAKRRGFDNAVMCDPIGNVAELTAQNLMLVKDGVVHTPVPNGTFLNGITRQRVIGLLREDGVDGASSAPSGRPSCSRPTRSSPPATTARSCRACATSRAPSRPVRSTAGRASSTGRSRTAAAAEPAAAARLAAARAAPMTPADRDGRRLGRGRAPAAVPGARPARRRRHGRGLPRARRAARPRGGDQGAAGAGGRRPRRAGALRARGARRGHAVAPRHRHHLRVRARARPAAGRHGAAARRDAAPAPRSRAHPVDRRAWRWPRRWPMRWPRPTPKRSCTAT